MTVAIDPSLWGAPPEERREPTTTTAIDPGLWGAPPKKPLSSSGWQAGARRWPVLILGVLLAVPLIGFALVSLFGHGDPPKHKQVVQIALISQPPPPPPRPQEEPPKPKDAVKLDEPKPTPDDPKPAPEAPPPGPLGLDATGTGPGDGFGLAGRPGGRDIIASAGGGGLGWNLFGASTARHVAQDLAREPRLRKSGYRIEIRVWLGKDGNFLREEIVKGTGDKELDSLIEEGLRQLSALHQSIPDNLPQPLRIRVTSSDA